MKQNFKVDGNKLGRLLSALQVIRQACTIADVPYFIIGAAARDLLMQYVHDMKPFRATLDVDAAIAVQRWEEYQHVISLLLSDFGLEQGTEPHRVSGKGITLDIVPFGGIADDDTTIEWPQTEKKMSVVGFAAVFEAAVEVTIDDEPPIPTASLPGLAILKLISWDEKPWERQRDALDIYTIMAAYHEVIGDDLYELHSDLFDENFDLQYASARIYGRDVAAILTSRDLQATVLRILEDNTADELESKLALAMGDQLGRNYELRVRHLQAFQTGISERLRP